MWLASFALDTEDKVHIIYYDRTTRSVKYTTNTSGIWVTEIVDSGGFDSFALDSDGKVHISYSTNSTNSDVLKYTTNKSGAWVTEIVDYPLECSDTSLALDANGHAHISNAHYTGLRYSTNKSGSWINETVDDGYNEGVYCSLAVDAKGRAHISYMVEGSGSNYPLKYATNKSGIWETEIVDVEAGPGIYSPPLH